MGSQPSTLHTLPSSQKVTLPGKHAPPLQKSLTVHTFPSLQLPLLLRLVQPLPGKQPSSVQGLPSSQAFLLAGTQIPLTQVLAPWKLRPSHAASAHTLPSLIALWLQPPAGSHLSLVQLSPSSHTVPLPPWHKPPSQKSAPVQGFPSSHAPLALVWVHAPARPQLSVVHAFWSSQLTMLPEHAPLLQFSPLVQAFPSSQVPVMAVDKQPLSGLQLSAVQAFPSSQFLKLPPSQPLAVHTKGPSLHLLPLVHDCAIFTVQSHPCVGVQKKSKHGSPKSQTTALPDLHAPSSQLSLLVHLSPSSQLPLMELCTHFPLAGSQKSLVQTLLSSHPVTLPERQTPL